MKLRLILWDQLSEQISSLKEADKKNDIILFLETLNESTYVKHHVKKLVFLLSAMRHFAEQLKRKGFCHVHYVSIADKEKTLTSGLHKVLKKYPIKEVVVTEPGEYRIRKEIESWKKKGNFMLQICPDDRFFCTTEAFKEWAKDRPSLLMEHFYHQMRRKTGYLMTSEEKPVGGSWNYDKENRKPLKTPTRLPRHLKVKPDEITNQVVRDVKTHFPTHFGQLEGFHYAVTRKDALKAFVQFLNERLSLFGTYQDAMLEAEPFLYHSVISAYLNAGLLNPKEVCDAMVKFYEKGKAPLSSVEGYLRQILGWREFVRGIYWLKMPHYKKLNFLQARRKLPSFYWTGKTDMNCLKQVILQTEEHAYSHHIQRLMITGNFALLIGVLPKEICDWYLMVYADAHEWVELPNTLGMSQFADGGFFATKPYVSSGQYIHKMSNFCNRCTYNVNQKKGKKACPFNYLYWDFFRRNQAKLRKNPRVATVYQTLKKFPKERVKEISDDAKDFLRELD